jgi:hypothetical protein
LNTYRITEVMLPTSQRDASYAALNLDGDNSIDNRENAGGSALAALLNNFGSAEGLPALVNERLNSDEAPWFLILNRCEDNVALMWALRGSNPNSEGVYTVEARDALPAVGRYNEDLYVTVSGGGMGQMPVGIFADPLGVATSIWSPGTALAAELFINENDTYGQVLSGRLGLALQGNYMDVIAVPMTAYFNERLQAGTSRAAVEMDSNEDGVISIAEFKQFGELFLRPDIILYEGSEVIEGLSFAIPIWAVPTPVIW